jgi:hypothetical protein
VVEPFHQRVNQFRERRLPDFGGSRLEQGQRLLELGEMIGSARRETEPGLLDADKPLAGFAPQRLNADDVNVDRFRRRDQTRKTEGALHRSHRRADRSADPHVVQDFPPQPVRYLRTAFGHAADLQVDASGELLQVGAVLQTAAGHSLEERADGPPETAQALIARDGLDAGHGFAHRPGARVVAPKPAQQPALVHASLFCKVRQKLLHRDRLPQCRSWPAGPQIRVEKFARGHRAVAARSTHCLVFGIELERRVRGAARDLAQKDRELPTGALDHVSGRLKIGGRKPLDVRETALDLVGEFGHRLETEHADRSRGLVDVLARIVERRDILLALAKGGERGEPPGQRLVDLAPEADQGAELQVGDGFVRDGARRPADMSSAAPSGAIGDRCDGDNVGHVAAQSILKSGLSRPRRA